MWINESFDLFLVNMKVVDEWKRNYLFKWMDWLNRMILFFFLLHRIYPGKNLRIITKRTIFPSRELDHAMLRRLEKRVLVDLPSKEARQAMFQQFLPPTVIRENNGLVLFSDLDYTRLSNVCFDHSSIDSLGIFGLF